MIYKHVAFSCKRRLLIRFLPGLKIGGEMYFQSVLNCLNSVPSDMRAFHDDSLIVEIKEVVTRALSSDNSSNYFQMLEKIQRFLEV